MGRATPEARRALIRRLRARQPERAFRPELHPLEDRTVLSGGVTLSEAGVLSICGTGGNDTVTVSQAAGGYEQPDQILVTLNDCTYEFDAPCVEQIEVQLLGGADTFTLDQSDRLVTPPTTLDGGPGTDSVVFRGTGGTDPILVTDTTVALCEAGLLTFTSVKNLTLTNFQTATLTIDTLAGHLTAAGGAVTDSSIGNIAATGVLEITEVPAGPNAGLLSNSTFGTVCGQVLAGAIEDVSFGTIASGALVQAAGQGTTSNVTIGTLSGSLLAPEDTNTPTGQPLPGSGVMSNTSITSISTTGVVSTGHISGMSVGTAAGSITAAGQGTMTNVTIGTLSGSLTAPEDTNTPTGEPLPGSGVMSNTSIGTIAGQGFVSTGHISGMTVGTVEQQASITAAGQGTMTNVTIGTLSGSLTAPEDTNTPTGEPLPGSGVMSNTSITSVAPGGVVSTGNISGMTVGTVAAGASITAAGQGTTSNVTIGTLAGSLTAPEDANPGSGRMSNTSIGTVSATGVISTGAISGMTVGTAAGSITAAGHGTITDITINLLTGTVFAPQDPSPGSGVITNATVTTLGASGAITAGATVNNLVIVTSQGGSVSAAKFTAVTATAVTTPSFSLVENGVTRTLAVSAAPGFNGPASFGFVYDGSGSGNPVVSMRVDATGVTNARYDVSLTTDAAGLPRSGIDLGGLYAVGKGFVRNVVVNGSLKPGSANPGYFGLPAGTPGGIRLPLDSLSGVAFAGNVPNGSIVAQKVSAVAFGSANGIPAATATAGKAAGLLAPGTATAQANDTVLVAAGDGVPVAMFLVTGTSGFNGSNILFQDQAADGRPIAAGVRVATGNVQQIDLTGEAAALATSLPVAQSINALTGSLGDLTLRSNQDTPAVTALRIVGSLDLNGRVTKTIQTTEGDFGRAITDATGKIVGVTTVTVKAGGGITSTGRIVSAGSLVSSVTVQSGMDGVIAAQGDIGVIRTDAAGNAVVGSGPGSPLTRFGGVSVTGGTAGRIVALGNIFGDITTNGGLDGRIAAKGRSVAGLPAWRTGILGNINVNGGIRSGAAIVSAGLIGDDGTNTVGNDGVGTKLNVNGAIKGILAAGGDINLSVNGSLGQADVYENVATAGTPKYAGGANKAAIDAIFTNGNVALTIPDGLSLILTDLAALRVGGNGNLTGPIA